MRIVCFKTEYRLISQVFVTHLNDFLYYKWANSLIILLRVSI